MQSIRFRGLLLFRTLLLISIASRNACGRRTGNSRHQQLAGLSRQRARRRVWLSQRCRRNWTSCGVTRSRTAPLKRRLSLSTGWCTSATWTAPCSPSTSNRQAALAEEIRHRALWPPQRSATSSCIWATSMAACIAWSAANGEENWTFEADGEISAGANFYQGQRPGRLAGWHALLPERQERAVVWKYSIDDQIRCTPTVVEGRAFVAGCDGALHIIDLTKGNELASVDIGAPTGVTPAAAGDQVYFGTEGSQFFCVDWKKDGVGLDL